MTQPTISKMVRDIEDELGTPLFDRSGREVALTDAGKIVFEQSKMIVRSFDHLSDELADLMNLKKGKVTIGLPPMIGAHFFPDILRTFLRKYPGVDVRVVEFGAKKVADAVADGSLDVGVTVGPFNQGVLDSFFFYDDPLRVVVNLHNPLASRHAVRLRELNGEPFILFPEEFSLHGMILNACESAGFHAHVVFESSQRDFMIELVAERLGVAFLPESVAREIKNESVVTLPLTERDLTWHLSMIWKKNHYLSFAARTWIRETKSALEKKELSSKTPDRLLNESVNPGRRTAETLQRVDHDVQSGNK